MKTLWYIWCSRWHQTEWEWVGVAVGKFHIYQCKRCGARWIK